MSTAEVAEAPSSNSVPVSLPSSSTPHKSKSGSREKKVKDKKSENEDGHSAGSGADKEKMKDGSTSPKKSKERNKDHEDDKLTPEDLINHHSKNGYSDNENTKGKAKEDGEPSKSGPSSEKSNLSELKEFEKPNNSMSTNLETPEKVSEPHSTPKKSKSKSKEKSEVPVLVTTEPRRPEVTVDLISPKSSISDGATAKETLEEDSVKTEKESKPNLLESPKKQSVSARKKGASAERQESSPSKKEESSDAPHSPSKQSSDDSKIAKKLTFDSTEAEEDHKKSNGESFGDEKSGPNKDVVDGSPATTPQKRRGGLQRSKSASPASKKNKIGSAPQAMERSDSPTKKGKETEELAVKNAEVDSRQSDTPKKPNKSLISEPLSPASEKLPRRLGDDLSLKAASSPNMRRASSSHADRSPKKNRARLASVDASKSPNPSLSVPIPETVNPTPSSEGGQSEDSDRPPGDGPTTYLRDPSDHSPSGSPKKTPDIKEITVTTLKDLKEVGGNAPETIVTVDLTEKELKDVPKEIKNLPNLSRLLLHGNQISELPLKIKSNSIMEIDISNNEIHTLSEGILNFRKVKKLNLTGNSFDFGDISPLGKMKYLQELSLNYCYLNTLPDSLSSLPLKRLELSHNEFKEFPQQILSLTSLSHLYLDFNKVGKVPLELMNLRELVELRLQGNPIGDFPAEIRAGLENLILEISIPNKIVDGLYLGDFLCAQNKAALTQLGITRLISVLQNDLPSTFNKDLHMQIALEDEETSNLLTFFPYANDYIVEALTGGHKVLVHCLAGVSRSASVVTSFLMKSKKIGVDEALTILKKARPIVNPNPGFLKQLKQYEKALNRLGDDELGALKSPRPKNKGVINH